MREKIVLLYEDDIGKTLCDVASRVLTAVSLSFGHTFVVSVRQCIGDEIDDDTLDICLDADAVLAASDKMACLDSLFGELYCTCRVRELRYDHMIDNRSLMGEDKPLRVQIVQALEAQEASLLQAASQAFALAKQEGVALRPVPPSGKLREEWEKAVIAAQNTAEGIVYDEMQLPDVLPHLIRDPQHAGVLLCPPYAGMVLSPALTALCGAPSMGYDMYLGGQCPLYTALSSHEYVIGDGINPFGLLRAVEHLLRESFKMELEAGCVEAALRNVLQAGWRSPDIASAGMPQLGATSMAELLCQQIEVAGEWVSNP